MVQKQANEILGLLSVLPVPGMRRVLFEANAVKQLGFEFPSFYGKALMRGIQPYAVTPLEYGVVSTGLKWKDDAFGRLMEDSVAYHVAMEFEIMPEQIDYNDPDQFECVEKWRSLALGFRERAERAIRRMRPHRIVYFQGYYLEAAVLRALAIEYGIPLLAWENSFLNDRLIWETVSGITVNRNLAQNYAWRCGATSNVQDSVEFSVQTMQAIKKRKSGEHQSPATAVSLGEKGPVLLYIGQVYTDSSVLFGRTGFETPECLIERILDYCEKNGYRLIAKLHPKENGGANPLGREYDQLTWRKIQNSPHLSDAFSDGSDHVCDFENTLDTYSLISGADLVVTINSQAGLEAAVMGKPVVICGRAFYDQAGFTQDGGNPSDLERALANAIENWSDEKHQLACSFFHVFTEHYCVKRSPGSIFKALRSGRV